MKGEILCEGETLGGEFSLLCSVLLILFNKILSFLCHINSWFLTILNCGRGCGFVVFLHVGGNCGQMWPMDVGIKE